MSGLDSLHALLQEELKDIYDAEKQLTKALPKMAKKASAAELKRAFEDHLRQTEEHVERIERVFERMEMPARGKKCVGMQNLIKEGDEMIAEAEDAATRDAVMIAAAQKVEHYEMASYGTVRAWANLLGKHDVASLLQKTLAEEKLADERLTGIAEGMVNAAAAPEGDSEEDEDMDQHATGRTRAPRARSTARAPRHQAADPGRSRGAVKRLRS
jgi:ferritin-like metal-binding protein YciE